MFIFGTRPEAIKLAPLIKAFQNDKRYSVIIVSTGQHKELLYDIIKLFDIAPNYNLNVMHPGQTLTELYSKIMSETSKVIQLEKPKTIFVHGDTATTASTSMAAFLSKIEVAHVEAGLRTYNNKAPWPEEVNRKITSQVSDYHFCPTSGAAENLIHERIEEEKIYITGNTVVDALFMARSIIKTNPYAIADFKSKIQEEISGRKFILMTGHRRENFGDGFSRIFSALKRIAEQNEELNIIYPVHLNPDVQKSVKDLLKGIKNIHLIKPVGYLEFTYLMEACEFILTDSGGIQEEAPSLNKPILVLREETERPEGIEQGCAKIVGTDPARILSEAQRLIDDKQYYEAMANATNPYGNGQSAARIKSIFDLKLK